MAGATEKRCKPIVIREAWSGRSSLPLTRQNTAVLGGLGQAAWELGVDSRARSFCTIVCVSAQLPVNRFLLSSFAPCTTKPNLRTTRPSPFFFCLRIFEPTIPFLVQHSG